MGIQLPELTVKQKWETAEENLVYFIVCGISYAKCHGGSAEDFGTWAGQVAARYWQADKGKGAGALVVGISRNKQQFRDFEMDILEESATTIRARMRNFGEDSLPRWHPDEITVDEYVQFFAKKWIAIADSLGLEYCQRTEDGWVHFMVTERAAG